ncbi:MAG TPA: hypothetical protein DEB06_07550 [Phycisphaerales bacterium]|nr:hypothetical protein [Phycisphaerales bacterium]
MLGSATPDGAALAHAVADERWLAGARVLKSGPSPPGGGGGRVLQGEAPVGAVRTPVVVKILPVTGARGALGGLLRTSRHWRQWRGAALLERRGFDAQQPLVLFRARGAGSGSPVEVLVLQFVPGRTALEHIARPEHPRQSAGVARAVARFTRRLADQWLLNRDHKPSNIVMVPGPQGEWRPTLIDTVGVRSAIGSPLAALAGGVPAMLRPGKDRRAHEALLCRMLATLLIEPIGIGHPVRPTDCMRALLASLDGPLFGSGAAFQSLPRIARRAVVRARWARVTSIIARHADPTPRDDPLPRP